MVRLGLGLVLHMCTSRLAPVHSTKLKVECGIYSLLCLKLWFSVVWNSLDLGNQIRLLAFRDYEK